MSRFDWHKGKDTTCSHAVNAWHSIRTRLILIIVILMCLILFGVGIMNYTMLSPFYESSKTKMLESSYSSVNKIVSADDDYILGGNDLSEKSQLQLEIIDENRSLNIYVFRVTNAYGQLYYKFDYSGVSQGKQQIIEDLAENYLYADESGSFEKKDNNERKLIRKQKQYNIFKVYDDRIGSYYMELFGELDTGSFVYLRTNYQSMHESIAVFNRFITYSATGILIIGMCAMIFFGNRFAKPIMQIADIAKRMSELDFEVKYPVTTQDEIGVLGSSINLLSENLEKTISELKTANNQLQRDIEKKTQIDEMRKEFLSNVSHELKTPIALIQGYAEGLQDNINDDVESRAFYCDVILDEAKKMNKMVQKLLTLNQIEFGNNQVSFERFDIISLVSNIMQSSMLLVEQKEATISFEREYAPIYVWADEYMTEEVVTNYISNAINHVAGEKKIQVSITENENNIRIRVFNTGKCIPEEDIDKIWIKFYKVDKARTREYGGSGIGLSIVKAIMDSMNQQCGVINHEDGVEFWFELDKQN